MIHTLRGIFPEPKQTHRRNFIKENVKQIKRIQGVLNHSSDTGGTKINSDKYQNVPTSAAVKKVRSKPVRASKSVTNNQPAVATTRSAPKQELPKAKSRRTKEHQMQTSVRGWNARLNNSGFDDAADLVDDERVTHRSVQTEDTSNPHRLYQSGVIKYPSPAVSKMCKKRDSPSPRYRSTSAANGPSDHGDDVHVGRRSPTSLQVAGGDGGGAATLLGSDLGSMRISELSRQHDFIRENAMAIRQRTARPKDVRDPNKAPPEYKKGVVPRYIQERKEEIMGDVRDDTECPDGHILLPDDERKETLRVLRQSYAERIQELNGMPVRTDTLRQRKRKMEIEEELKKIDEGIKVFQRPKVYVKINT